MNILLKSFLCIVLSSFMLFQQAFAAINYTVTPIVYELEMQPGESKTLPASIKNNGPNTVTLPTAVSDFQANGLDWVPSLVRKSELVYPDQELATWITPQSPSVTMLPGEEATIDFTIDVPTTATPGWHYGAVLFTNAGEEKSASGDIGISVDYGILILVNVSGEVIVGAEISNPTITNGGWGYTWSGDVWLFEDGLFSYTPNNNSWYVWDDDDGQAVYQNQDSCPLGDFTPDRYDGQCFGSMESESPENETENTENNNNWEEQLTSDTGQNQEDFNVDFTFPIKNIGNTHIKPTGKITLKDENGEIIKAIGKETISNDRWAILWEEIVDYIPINDQGGNVLPYSQRVFQSEWKGFPYKTYDREWNQIVNYWTPSEYYTQKNKQEAGFLMFWERVSESRQHKTITAEIEIIYYDELGNPIEFSSAQEFPVQYVEQVISVNPYVILSLLLLLSALIFTWFALRWWLLLCKKRACWNCKEKIKSHWETCPYCAAIQDKKKHKAYETQKEKEPIKKTPVKRKAPIKKAPVKKTAVKKTPSKK